MARRRLVGLAVGACVGRGQAALATSKVTQAAAQYQDHPHGGLSCIGCTFFRHPQSCQVVEGTISPNGWCRLFDLPD